MINKNYGVYRFDIEAERKEAKREAKIREAKRELRKSLWEEDYRVMGLFYISLLLSVFATIRVFITLLTPFKGV